jgi:cysteinyl-tRNA synthetase
MLKVHHHSRGGNNEEDTAHETGEYIQHHVDARVIAKKERNFNVDVADKIRLDLAQRFDVTINDKSYYVKSARRCG